MDVKTRVTELEPNWLLVVFQGPKPPTEKRAFWLNRTLTDWLGDHPGRVVIRTLPILHQGELVAVHVWLDEPEAATPPRTVIQIDRELTNTLPKEHLEAMLQNAYAIFFERRQASRLIVINRRKIVVAFDRALERIAIVPFDRLQLDEPSMKGFQEWLATKQTRYFVIELPRQEEVT